MKILSEGICVDAPSADDQTALTLHGTLTFMEGQLPQATAIIHPGSGPTDRDGNSSAGLHTDCLKQLAELLTRRNLAVVRIDKRGVGESVSPQCTEESLTVDLYASDLIVWHAALKARFCKPVYLIGHSEGALISQLAATRCSDVEALILLCATSYRLHEILLQQFGDRAPEQVPAIQRIVDQLLDNQADVFCPPELMYLFRPSVQPYWMSVMRYCPLQLIAELSIPVLVAGGGKDVQVRAEDTKRLAGSASHATTVCVDQMGHTLKMATDASSIEEHYRNPSMPVAEELVDRVHQFICTNLR